jgi:hypothetical protein
MRAEGDNQGLRFHASVPLISQGRPLGLINAAATEWQFLTHPDLHFLSAVSAQLVVALERAHFYEIAERRLIILEDELLVAREVRRSSCRVNCLTFPAFVSRAHGIGAQRRGSLKSFHWMRIAGG